jgi:hypothetical protein
MTAVKAFVNVGHIAVRTAHFRDTIEFDNPLFAYPRSEKKLARMVDRTKRRLVKQEERLTRLRSRLTEV